MMSPWNVWTFGSVCFVQKHEGEPEPARRFGRSQRQDVHVTLSLFISLKNTRRGLRRFKPNPKKPPLQTVLFLTNHSLSPVQAISSIWENPVKVTELSGNLSRFPLKEEQKFSRTGIYLKKNNFQRFHTKTCFLVKLINCRFKAVKFKKR